MAAYACGMPIFDGHNDFLSSQVRKPGEDRSFFVRSDQGHMDLPRAHEGCYGGGLFACFAPDRERPDKKRPDEEREDSSASADSPIEDEGAEAMLPDLSYAQQCTIPMMASLFRLEAGSEGKLKVVRTVREIEACLQQGILAAVLHFEGAEAIDPELDALHVFYQAGLRSVGLVWSRPNVFGYGVPFEFPHSPDTGPGLTDAGKALVRACNQLGILVDLSHLNEQGFWDVASISDAPLVATHSNAHALCPSTRNLTDRQLDAIRDSRGLVGINFHVGFLRADGQAEIQTPIADIVRHVDYIAERIGPEHVAFGSDFDGATMPQELGDVAGLPKLVDALRDRGYGLAELRAITHENWIRVLRQTWKGATPWPVLATTEHRDPGF
jgi:membrane dipeptidase